MDPQLQALRDLIADPSGNFDAAAVAVLVVVLLVIIVVLVLIALALPGRRDRDEHEDLEEVPPHVPSAPARRGLGPGGCLALIALLTLGGVVSTLVWYDTTSTNTYCTETCHAMARPSASWKISAHRKVSCVRCHEGRHWESFLSGVTLRTYSLYLQASGAKPRNLPVPDSRCLECHGAVVDKRLYGLNGESFTHAEFGDQRCSECHGKQGHLPKGADEAVPTP